MKRFIVIFAVLLPALTGQAQEVEMFSLEREIEVPGVPKKDLRERAWKWFRSMDMLPGHEFDFKEGVREIGYRNDWIRRNCNIVFKGKDYRTEYTFSLSIVSREDGYCTIRLFRPLVSSHRGNATILSVDDLPVFYGGYNKGMFGAFRNKEARIAVCDEVKQLLTEEFDQMVPDIERALWERSGNFELFQE